MEESDGAENAVAVTALNSSAEPEPEFRQGFQVSVGVEAAAKAFGASLVGKLREPDSLSGDENEASARRIKPARRLLRCQVDGCGVDLSQARKYFQRYRVCERHLKAPSLQMDGHSVRFCDQCSRFHDITQFEGLRRTCNEKLERTRQARSDKRRQQSEQAERAAIRASGGWRSRGFGGPGPKRQHDDGFSHDDPTDEDYAPGLGSNTHLVAKRSKVHATPPPSQQQQQQAPLHLPGPTVLASLSDQLKAQGMVGLQRAALVAAAACGGVNSGLVAGGAGGDSVHPDCVQGLDAGRGAGSNDGCGAGGGAASSLSSWDDGHPQMQLLRTDSVSSGPGCAGTAGQGSGSHGAAPGRQSGAAALFQGAGLLPYRHNGREVIQKGQRQALEPGSRAGLAAAAALVQDRLQSEGGSGGGGGGGGGRVLPLHHLADDCDRTGSLKKSVQAGAAGRATAGNGRAELEALLVQVISRSNGYGPVTATDGVNRMAATGLLGLEAREALDVDPVFASTRAGNGAITYGSNGRGAGDRLGYPGVPSGLAPGVSDTQLVLQFPDERDVGGLLSFGTSASRGSRGVGARAPDAQVRLLERDPYGCGAGPDPGGEAGAGEGAGAAATTAAAALRIILSDVAPQLGGARSQPGPVPALHSGDHGLREQALAAAEALIRELRTGGRGAGGLGLPAGTASSDLVYSQAFRSTGPRFPQEAPAARSMPVLDLTAPQTAVATARAPAVGWQLNGSSDAAAFALQLLQQRQQQQELMLSLQPSAPPFVCDEQPPAEPRVQFHRQSDDDGLLLLQQALLQKLESFYQDADELKRQAEQELHMQLLRRVLGRDGCGAAAPPSAAPLASSFCLPQLDGSSGGSGGATTSWDLQMRSDAPPAIAETGAAAAAAAVTRPQRSRAYDEVMRVAVPPATMYVDSNHHHHNNNNNGNGNFNHLQHLLDTLHQIGVQLVVQ